MHNRILWIEDESYIIKGIVRPLEKQGFSITDARNAYEAAEQLVKKDYDLIVADLILPLSELKEDDLPEFMRTWGEESYYLGVDVIKFIRQNLGITTPVLVLSVIDNPIERYSLQSLGEIYSTSKVGLLPSRFKETALNIINQSSSAARRKAQNKRLFMANRTDLPNQLQIFLCHSSADKPIVREIHGKLKSEGFSPWLDEINLIPGQEWDVEIKKAVKNSHAVLVCLSNSSVSKEGYVQKEIRFALDIALEKPEGTIYIVPVRLEECKVPESLLKYQYADYFTNQGQGKLLGALQKRLEDVFG